jgi:hypothetical protein
VIAGPLLNRIGLHVEVPAVPFTQLAEMPPGPTPAELRQQVLEARARQAKRFGPKGVQVKSRGQTSQLDHSPSVTSGEAIPRIVPFAHREHALYAPVGSEVTWMPGRGVGLAILIIYTQVERRFPLHS